MARSSRRGSPRTSLLRAALAAAVSAALILTAPLQPAAGPSAASAPAAADAALPDPWGTLLASAPEEPAEVQREERLEVADLLAAPVPPLCGHPAGTLQDGMLPGIPPGDGVVWIYVDESGRIPTGRVAYGEPGDEIAAAVAVYCDRGGASWPEAVVLYGPGPTYLGHVQLSDLTPGRQSVASLTLADGVVRVRFVNSWAADEVGQRGRVDGTVDLVLAGGRVVSRNLQLVDERPTAERAVRAAVAGDENGLARVAGTDAATALLAVAAREVAADPAAELVVGACSTPLAGAPAEARATCLLEFRSAADPAAVRQVAQLHLARTAFATWQVVAVTDLAAPVPGA